MSLILYHKVRKDNPMKQSTPWRVYAIQSLLRLGGWLPLSWFQSCGKMLAILARWAKIREYRVAQRNIELCFPSLSATEKAEYVHSALTHTAMNLTELPRLWGVNPNHALKLIREIRGVEYLRTAIGQGSGVIVAAPHLGQWELLNLYLCTQGPMALLYRQPQHSAWEPLLISARGALGAIQIRADASGVRQLFRCLKENMLVGILPDQRPKGGEGEFAPFFGLPCKSMTLLARLANKTGAPVVFGFAERLPEAAGFRLHFLPAPEDIDAADPKTAVASLHTGIEACVRLAPQQYQWTYKRFSLQPNGESTEMYPGSR